MHRHTKCTKVTGDHQKVEGGTEQILPQGIQKETTLLIPQFWTLEMLENNFYCFKPSGLW